MEVSSKYQVVSMDKKKIKSFTDLQAWQEAHKLVLLVYQLTDVFPSDQKFGLVNQMQRAAVSVSSNIAEGFSRQSLLEKKQFYYQSLGSLTELQNQLLIARDLKYLPKEQFNDAAQISVSVSKLTNALIKYVKAKHT